MNAPDQIEAKQRSVKVKIGSQSRVFSVERRGAMRPLDDSLLIERSGEAIGAREIVTARYLPADIRAYHRHKIGRPWVPTAPAILTEAHSVSFRRLSLPDFVEHLPETTLINHGSVKWFPSEIHVTGYELEGDKLVLKATQSPEMGGISAFEVKGTVVGELSFLKGKAVLEMSLHDIFGLQRKFRLYHDGHSGVRFGIQHSRRFDSVYSISCDGIRTRFAYRLNEPGIQVATIYSRDPSLAYSIGRPDSSMITGAITHWLRPTHIFGVRLRRQLEVRVLDEGNAYDHGRIGAEIAYTIASIVFNIHGLSIAEPASGGADLASKDGNIAVEARMLTRTREQSLGVLAEELARHRKQMMRKLDSELLCHRFRTGYVILSFQLKSGSVVAIVEARTR